MQPEILEELKRITPEEEAVRNGQDVDRSLYQDGSEGQYQIEAAKLLEQGKLITIRKHTRFVHFPPHTHNYVEVVYMCSGSTTHIVNGRKIRLNQGELLFLNQNSVQEILSAGEDDIAVNFIILPEFFDYALGLLDGEENLLRNFIIDCMTGANKNSRYMLFRVADVLPVQNLVENLIWTLMHHQPDKRRIHKATMGLLLLQLLNQTESLDTDGGDEGDKLSLTVLRYIDEHYRDGELTELASQLGYDVYYLSRQIKERLGQNYTDLVQAKRLARASWLLQHTEMAVSEIAEDIGYENCSYFHRIFKARYGCSPKKYRDGGL